MPDWAVWRDLSETSPVRQPPIRIREDSRDHCEHLTGTAAAHRCLSVRWRIK
jgi:hypothetical protein